MFANRKHRTTSALLASVVILALGIRIERVLAEPGLSRQESEVKYRQSLFTVIGANFAPLAAMAEGAIPVNALEAQKRASRVAFLAPMLNEAFPSDSNGVSRTAARPAIWSDPATFDKELQALIKKAAFLASAVQSSDAAKIKNAIEDIDDTCKGCHYDFKARR